MTTSTTINCAICDVIVEKLEKHKNTKGQFIEYTRKRDHNFIVDLVKHLLREKLVYTLKCQNQIFLMKKCLNSSF